MNKTIQIAGVKYLIRGPHTPAQVRQRYNDFKLKYPTSQLTFVQWAVQRGAVYFHK